MNLLMVLLLIIGIYLIIIIALIYRAYVKHHLAQKHRRVDLLKILTFGIFSFEDANKKLEEI